MAKRKENLEAKNKELEGQVDSLMSELASAALEKRELIDNQILDWFRTLCAVSAFPDAMPLSAVFIDEKGVAHTLFAQLGHLRHVSRVVERLRRRPE